MSDFTIKQKEYLSASFNTIVLPGKEIESTSFEDCFFEHCNFIETSFIDCKFTDCKFSHCNFSAAKLTGSRLSEVIFNDCKVIGIDWTKAVWPSIPLFSPIKFFKCILNDSTFMGLSLNEIAIEACKAMEVDFREGCYCDANFRYTDFTRSLFNDTNISGADFSDAINYRIDINYNIVKGAKFSRHEAVSLLESLEIELVE